MLKTAVVYIQGSTGTLVTRALSLANNTVAYLPQGFSDTQPDLLIDSYSKLKYYSNFGNNWAESEGALQLWYHSGLQHFVNYEYSSLNVIDSFHPCEFEIINADRTLWADKFWEKLIFITWEPEEVDEIINNVRLKRPARGDEHQIRSGELSSYWRLRKQYPDALEYRYSSSMKLDTFKTSILALAKELNLIINQEHLEEFWRHWHQEHIKIINA